ncbi:MAG: HEAT repeat domain-containing protein [Ilumatobacter fluminis]|uniref:HEAT repeat domain-containing protein n=1 Tax=Ilumatobacter fluminis TaxID=467091 RepID=UPI0032EBB543
MSTDTSTRRRAAVLAGHTGDADAARAAWGDPDGRVREAALGALERCDALDGALLGQALLDPDTLVRRRAAELAARHPDVDLLATLDDADPDVVEVAAWACGEQLETSDDPDLAVVQRLAALATDHDAPLVREASAAALGAIGHPAGLPAILQACDDKPQIRRRAVLALAPFEGPEVAAAIERALTDRDWQVRQAAEDLRRAEGEVDT